MAEQQQRRSSLSVDLGGRYFGWDPNPSKNNYVCVDMRYWNNSIYLTFTKKITDSNEIVLSCYLNQQNVSDFSHMLEGIMARRRDAFINGTPYDTEDNFKIPITKFDSATKTETVLADLTVTSEMVDGESRIKLSYYEYAKDSKIDVIFCNNREVINKSTGTISLNKIDLKDIGIYNFLRMIKLTNDPTITFSYNLMSSAISAIGKMLGVNKGSNNGNGSGGYTNYNNRSEDYPETEMPF